MFEICLLLIFFAVFTLILGIMPVSFDQRPTLMMDKTAVVAKKKQGPLGLLLGIVRKVAFFNKPLAMSPMGRRMFKDLSMGHVDIKVEEFFLIKELLVLAFVGITVLVNPPQEFLFFIVAMAIAAGYMGPEMWLKKRIAEVKDMILKDLPDTVDLLGLCVNAGLDFMMALKYVVDKSQPSVIVEEMRVMMQEINVGKPRREALRDMSRKYEMPDLSTFSRTLIQADRMGTSVSEALNILSEDMREARFRRGEAMALKAPLKMLVPLLFFIFPVVAILVAGPVFLDFMQNNPLQNIGK